MIHGDLLPLVVANMGIKIDGKKFVVINAGGSHEEYIARAVAKNIPGAVQISKYASLGLRNANDLSTWRNFTKAEQDDFKGLAIKRTGSIARNQSQIQGNPVVVLTSIIGMRKGIFGNLASLVSFSDYSFLWLDLYLHTVLREDSLGSSLENVRSAVLLMRKIIEADDFGDLIQDPDLDKYPNMKDLIGNLNRSYILFFIF